MKIGLVVVLGSLLDVLISPVTLPIWKELIHNNIVKQLTDAEWSEVLVLILLDVVLAAVIMVFIGIFVAERIVQYLFSAFNRG